MKNNFVKITPAELLQNMLNLEKGETLDVGAWWDSIDDVAQWHSITNISAESELRNDYAPTFLFVYYGAHASAIAYAYDNECHGDSIDRLTSILQDEDLLDGDGTVCMEVPSEE